MEELEYSEEEIEIEVQEEVEVEVEEEDEEPDEEKKKENQSTIKKPERKSILIKKRCSEDFRKDILLRASLSDQANSKLIVSDKHKSNENTSEFNIDNYLQKTNSKPIEENIKDENEDENLCEDKIQQKKEENKNEENINNNKDIKDEVNNNNEINENNNIIENKSKEEMEYIEKIVNLMKTNEVVNLLESKKWEDKKLGLIKLNEFIEKSTEINGNLDTYIIYIKDKLNNFKETNFNIIKEGMRCLCTLFNKIERSDKPNNNYIEIILNGLNEKIADAKLKDIYIELLDSLMKSYSEKIIIDTLLSLLESCKKVVVLKEYSEYIDKIIEEKLFKVDLNIKGIIDFLVNLCNNSNQQLRAVSSKTICHLYKYLGSDLKLMIKNIKESTLKNIYKEMDKIDEEKSKNNENKIEEDSNNISKETKSDNNNQKNNSDKSNINSNNLTKPVDISKLIPPKLLREIDKGKWQEKKDGVDFIIKVIDNGNKKILPDGLKDLFDLIQEKLSDANKNFVRIIIQLLSLLILSLGENIKVYSKIFVKPLLLNLSDKNQLLREDCVECINKLIDNQNFEIIANFLPNITDIENSDMRNEILNLLISNIHSLLNDNYSETFYKELTKALINFLQDKSNKIKGKTETFIIKFKDKIKKENYLKEIDKYKPSIAEDLKNIFNKLFPENNQKQNEKEKITIKKSNTAKKEITTKNQTNKNNLIKKIDINKKSKISNIPRNHNKDFLLKELNQNNKSTILNTPKKNNILKNKNKSQKIIVNEDNDKKIMNKTAINWRKPQVKKENSLIISNKKTEKNKKINIKNRPKLSLNDINSKANISATHERIKTDSNQKNFKISKEKPLKTERNIENKVNKKNIPVKKLTYNKINPNTVPKKNINKTITPINIISKEDPRKTKKNNNNINNKDSKVEKKSKNIFINKEELLTYLNTLLNNENEITLYISDIYNLMYKNFANNKDVLIKNSDIIFQTFIYLIKKLFSHEKIEIKVLKYVTIVLCKISGLKELVSSISYETHLNLINLIFFFVSYEEKNRLEEDEEGIIVWKSFNSMMLHIIDYCNFSENIHILLQLIKKNIKEDKQKLSEYGSRCLAFINQMIKDIYSQLKINEILKEIHYLIIEYEIKRPNLQYKNKKEKIIIQSITGLINELVKAKKDSIMDEYNKEIEIFEKNDKYILNWIKEDLDKIKEEEREREMKLNIDADIENLISEKLLTEV